MVILSSQGITGQISTDLLSFVTILLASMLLFWFYVATSEFYLNRASWTAFTGFKLKQCNDLWCCWIEWMLKDQCFAGLSTGWLEPQLQEPKTEDQLAVLDGGLLFLFFFLEAFSLTHVVILCLHTMFVSKCKVTCFFKWQSFSIVYSLSWHSKDPLMTETLHLQW